MKKQLESELKELAITILNNDSETPIETLKKQASLLYERLTILAYTEKNTLEKTVNTPVNIQTTTIQPKAPLIALEKEPELPEAPIKTIIKLDETSVPNTSSPDLLFELDELTAGFENLPEFEPANSTSNETTVGNLNNNTPKPKSSLNDSLKKGINIGLNDRLAFVKHLFNNNQDDYTRVISQLNTLESKSGALNFIQHMVKPEYNNWQGKETFEERFMNAVFSKFEF